MKISVFGTGYVGLVTGTCFAEMGNDVICADIDTKKIAKLQDGVMPIYEPGLEELVVRNVKDQRLSFTTDLASSVTKSKLLFIAVGTPQGEDGSADLKYVLNVARFIGESMQEYKAVFVKSTVPVGTCDKVEAEIKSALAKRQLKLEFDVLSNPEFLKEGAAIEDALKPSRVVVGASSERAIELASELYDPFVKNGHPIYTMDRTSSELTKYAANAMLATRISFMNELSRLCEKVGANIEKIRLGIGSDPRIGKSFIYPGLGYGGSCFPKDVKALIHSAESFGEDFKILRAVEETNQLQRKRFIDHVLSDLGPSPAGKSVAIWGLAFKPGTDDIREAPALDLIQTLLARKVKVRAFDPVAEENAALEFKNPELSFHKDKYDTLKDAHLLCICTEWLEFREPDFPRMKTLMKDPTIFDGRNIYRPKTLQENGFRYHSIGRK